MCVLLATHHARLLLVLILINTLWCRYYYQTHFTDEKTVSQRDYDFPQVTQWWIQVLKCVPFLYSTLLPMKGLPFSTSSKRHVLFLQGVWHSDLFSGCWTLSSWLCTLHTEFLWLGFSHGLKPPLISWWRDTEQEYPSLVCIRWLLHPCLRAKDSTCAWQLRACGLGKVQLTCGMNTSNSLNKF